MSSKEKVFEVLKNSTGGLSASEIGAIVGCQVNTVIKNIHYLKKDGNNIQGKMRRAENRFGEKVEYKEYSLCL